MNEVIAAMDQEISSLEQKIDLLRQARTLLGGGNPLADRAAKGSSRRRPRPLSAPPREARSHRGGGDEEGCGESDEGGVGCDRADEGGCGGTVRQAGCGACGLVVARCGKHGRAKASVSFVIKRHLCGDSQTPDADAGRSDDTLVHRADDEPFLDPDPAEGDRLG